MSKNQEAWAVTLELGCVSSVADELAARLADELGVAGIDERGDVATVTATVNVRAGDAIDAIAQARERLVPIAGPAPIVAVHAVLEEDFDAELARPVIPALVGLTEAGEILGVSRQRVGALVSAGQMPAPVAQLASGPVFLESAVRAFAAVPRRAGRPARQVG